MKTFWILIIIIIFLLIAIICYFIKRRKKREKKEAGLRSESKVYRDLEDDLKGNSNENNYSLDDSKYEQFKEKLKIYKDEELHHAIAVISGELKALDVEAIQGAVYTTIFTSASAIVTEQLATVLVGELPTNLFSNSLIVFFAALYMSRLLKDYTDKKWQEYFIQILQFELEHRGKEEAKKVEEQEKEITRLNAKMEALEKEVKKFKRKIKK